jgi:3-hydroxyisobutyrate dehydrogenase-like beta-hydroxyacid dehydrogenase
MGPREKLHFCGQLGNGLAAKIANNYISCCNMLLAAEAMAMGMRYGVDKKVLFHCITSSSGDSWTFRNGMPVPGVVADSASSRGFTPTFKPFMIIKDITLGIKSAEKVGIEPAMGRPLLKAFEKAADDPRTKVCWHQPLRGSRRTLMSSLFSGP